MLKRKVKELKAVPKIKIPEALKKYRKRKNTLQEENFCQSFPDIKNTLERIKSVSWSPIKKKNQHKDSLCLIEVTSRPKRFVLDKSRYYLMA